MTFASGASRHPSVAPPRLRLVIDGYSDPECRYRTDGNHQCRSAYGRPLQPGQACHLEARKQMIEAARLFTAASASVADHVTEVVKKRRYAGGQAVSMYQAVCSCSWFCWPRSTPELAGADVVDHQHFAEVGVST